MSDKPADERDFPRVFIGASTEKDHLVSALHTVLEEADIVAVSWRDAISPQTGTETTISSLQAATTFYDFGVFLLDTEDTVFLRDKNASAPRGNVLFEFGLFLGTLTANRTFGVWRETADAVLPSDLKGIVGFTWQDKGENDQSKMRTVADKLKPLILGQGRRQDQSHHSAGISFDGAREPSDHTEKADGWQEGAKAGFLIPLSQQTTYLGDQVVHPRYGVGIVIERGPGDEDAPITVQFAARTPAIVYASGLFCKQFLHRGG